MTAQPEVLLDGIVFPEGPRWHDGKLWFSDMHSHRVMTVDPQGQSEVVTETDGPPSGLGFLPDGTLLIAGMHTRLVWRFDGAELKVHADLRDYPGEFLNDMVVDADGRAYVGCRWHRRPDRTTASDLVIMVQPDGASSVALDDVVGPNGTVITADGSTLILAETQAHRITSFDRAPDGSLSGRRPFADLGRSFPDGISLDADGALWVGTALGKECLRVAEGGEILERISYDERWAVACTLGGPDRRRLYLCTADTTLPGLRAMAELEGPAAVVLPQAREHSHGYIEQYSVAVGGVGLP